MKTLTTILTITCAAFANAQTTYPDGRPAATLRMDAKDQGVILKHGDGPCQCDYLGAREALIFEENGVYPVFNGAPGGNSTCHMKRDLGLAWLDLPLSTPKP